MTDRYLKAGVDIRAGDAFVRRIAPMARSTFRPEVLTDLGSFGGMFAVPSGRFRDLVLIASTDGVGTKVKLAERVGWYGGLGIDLVAMCVNDVVVHGAEPWLFLDYYATGRLDVDRAAEVVQGIAEGCRQAGCALLGGETAEMPGVYPEGGFDLAGFVVGAVERDGIVDGRKVRPGMAVVGLPSTGVHSNGFSLVRRVVEETGADLDAPLPEMGDSLGRCLLAPTRIYVRGVLAAMARGRVHACAHITGGGLVGNIPRVLPEECAVELDRSSWLPAPVLGWLQREGALDDAEMVRTFNGGLGMVLVVEESDADAIVGALRSHGDDARVVGGVVARDGGTAVRFQGRHAW
ncbi:phosphoribosylformylglycinamidine cyclo-ligase [Myxococcota bacterium]|nr:phosphoribosylformylglycinamidine cyclo-ligase [Myxococcota bacterium]